MVLALPLLVSACFGVLGPGLARRLPPRHATWLLSGGATVTALSGLAVLVLLGSTLVGQEPEIAREGHWSVTALRAHAPVDRDVGLLALLVAVAAAAAAVAVAARRGRAVLAAYRACRELPSSSGELVVVADAAAAAYALPGRPGRIVVAQSLLAALSGPERRALFAHERAHLKHAHHWHLTLVTVAATLNPLLQPLRRAVHHAVERWADEAAATEVGDRRVVASAVARAAVLGGRGPASALAAGSHAVPQRVAALLGPSPRSRPGLMALTSLLLLAGAAAAAIAARETEDLFELAMRIYQST